jgi:hypothetical protein
MLVNSRLHVVKIVQYVRLVARLSLVLEGLSSEGTQVGAKGSDNIFRSTALNISSIAGTLICIYGAPKALVDP